MTKTEFLATFLTYVQDNYDLSLTTSDSVVCEHDKKLKIIEEYMSKYKTLQVTKTLRYGVYEFNGNTIHYDGDVAHDLDSGEDIPLELLEAMGNFTRPFSGEDD